MQIAKTVWTLFHECFKGKTALLSVLHARAALPPPANALREPRSEDGDTTDGTDEEEDEEGRGDGDDIDA